MSPKSLLIQECGLKFPLLVSFFPPLQVAPYTGAWIEISNMDIITDKINVAPYTGAWIEIIAERLSLYRLLRRSLYRSVD